MPCVESDRSDCRPEASSIEIGIYTSKDTKVTATKWQGIEKAS